MKSRPPPAAGDVESARRTEIYDEILRHFGGRRVACVAMIETYRVRHAVRDVGAALLHHFVFKDDTLRRMA